MSERGRVVVIMAKAPIAGQAKTRLIPLLGAEQAAVMYHQMLLDTIELVATSLNGTGAISLVCPTVADQTALHAIVSPAISVVADEQGSLMRGLDYGLRHHLDMGYEHVVMLNGDGPTLPKEYVRAAFEALRSSDVVLGPTKDGGYYLIGANEPQSALFNWEHFDSATVCVQTRERAEGLGRRVTLLPAWYDIDIEEDIQQLADDLRSEANLAPRTRQFLSQHGLL